MEIDSKTVGKFIVEQRDKMGWSQKRLAYEVGIRQSTLSKYERGEREPGATVLFLIAKSMKTKVYFRKYNFK